MRVKFICESCGDIEFDDENYQCPICNTKLTKVGFMDGHKLININGEQRIKWLENKLGHPLSDEINNLREDYYKKKRLEREKQKEEEQRRREEEKIAYELKILSGKGLPNVPKCPVCGSTSLKKISLTTRAVKTAAFGTIGAIDDAGKTYKCENCGSKF